VRIFRARGARPRKITNERDIFFGEAEGFAKKYIPIEYIEMQIKVKNHNIHVSTSKRTPGIVVSVGFKTDANFWVLEKLKTGKPCACTELVNGSQQSAVLFAIYDNVRNKFMNNPLQEIRSKVLNVHCGYQNGEFYISVVCAAQLGVFRRTLLTIVKNLSPGRLFPAYAHYMKMLNSTGHREDFDYCVGVVNSALDKGTNTVVVGKFPASFDKAKLTEMTDGMEIDFVGDSKKGKKPFEEAGKSTSRMHCDQDDISVLKAHGFDAYLTKRYLESQIPSTHMLVSSDQICVYNPRFPTILNKLNDNERIKTHVERKYESLGDDLNDVLVYLALGSGEVSPSTAKTFAGKKNTKADIVKGIKSCLVLE